MERVYKMGMYVNNKLVYIVEVEANSIESAREIAWENFETRVFAEEIDDENKTEDEIAYEEYLVGNCSYEDYLAVCDIQECEPEPKIR